MAVQNLAQPRSQAEPGNVIKGGSASRFDGRQSLRSNHYKAEPCNERHVHFVLSVNA